MRLISVSARDSEDAPSARVPLPVVVPLTVVVLLTVTVLREVGLLPWVELFEVCCASLVPVACRADPLEGVDISSGKKACIISEIGS